MRRAAGAERRDVIRAGYRPTLADKAETCTSEAELDGFLAQLAEFGPLPDDILQAAARCRARLKRGKA